MQIEQLRVSISEQRMIAYRNGHPVKDYPISTALAGPGEQKNSGCTPRGEHYIRARIVTACRFMRYCAAGVGLAKFVRPNCTGNSQSATGF